MDETGMVKIVQTDFWGQVRQKVGDYLVFHDESEPSTAWLLIGLLFVRSDRLARVQEVLAYHRQQENYTGEIIKIYSSLRKTFSIINLSSLYRLELVSV
jgi:hypothetical protein